MRETILDRQLVEFDDRNLVIQATLGLLSGCERLDDLLCRYAPPDGARPADEVANDDPGLDFVLGLIALRNRIVSVAERAAAALAEHPTPAAESTDAPAQRATGAHRTTRDTGLLR